MHRLYTLCVLLLSLLSLFSVGQCGVSPVSWPQQGGDSSNTGFGSSASFNGSAVSVTAQSLTNQQCEQSFIYSSVVNAFFGACWNYDPSGNNNVTLWQLDADTAQVRFAQSVTVYAQTAAGPQLATPALYEGSLGVMVFLQTDIELWSFLVDASSGVVASSSKVAIAGTVLCGTSLTVSLSQSLLLLQSNADVVAYKITAQGASTVAWTYSYPNPSIDYLLSAVSEDTGSELFVYTFSREYWGSDIVALDASGNKKWNVFYPVNETISIASTPLIAQARSYVSLYPYGLVVLDNSDGSIVTNGSYLLTQATGTTPNLWLGAAGSGSSVSASADSASAASQSQAQILYECEINDGIASTYQMCSTDLSGQPTSPWSGSIILGCINDTKWTSYGVNSQPIVAGASDTLVTASFSEYDYLSCVQVWDLGSGRNLLSYQGGPLKGSLIFGSPFVDAQGTVYSVAVNNDFVSTMVQMKMGSTDTQQQEEQQQRTQRSSIRGQNERRVQRVADA